MWENGILGVNPANEQAPFIGNRSDLLEMTEYLADLDGSTIARINFSAKDHSNWFTAITIEIKSFNSHDYKTVITKVNWKRIAQNRLRVNYL